MAELQVSANGMIAALRNQRDQALEQSALWEAKAHDLQRMLSDHLATHKDDKPAEPTLIGLPPAPPEVSEPEIVPPAPVES